jgi:hypothetical protein
LRAEISPRAEPRRSAGLSRRYLGLAPPEAGREITPEDLARLAAPPPPAPERAR